MGAHGENGRPCVLITHRILPQKDAEFLRALQRLHEERRARGWVTDRWLVLKNRDQENTYTQVLEYVSAEAEAWADQDPELGSLRRGIGKVSVGPPDHIWTVVARVSW